MNLFKGVAEKLLNHDAVVYAGFLFYALTLIAYLVSGDSTFSFTENDHNSNDALDFVLLLAMTLSLYFLLVARVRYVELNSRRACKELKDEIKQMKINKMLNPSRHY